MRYLFIFFLLHSININAQQISTVKFVDFHIHTTFNNYYKATNKEIEDIYNNRSDFEYVRSNYGKINWKTSGGDSKERKLGKTANLKKYDQSDYVNLSFTPGS